MARLMDFEVLQSSAGELCFATAPRARHGRGALYALAPWVAYLFAISIAFGLALGNLAAGSWIRSIAVGGAWIAFALTPIAYVLGYRARDRVEATPDGIRIQRTGALSSSRLTSLAVAELKGLGIDPSIRSLGADLLLVAIHRDGRRISIVEGEPHHGQLRQLAGQAAQITGLPLEAPSQTQQ
jgi:hypothetical protein